MKWKSTESEKAGRSKSEGQRKKGSGKNDKIMKNK